MAPEQIRKLRVALKETQDQFARRLGLAGKSYVSHLEAGRKEPAGSLLALLRLLAALGPKKIPKKIPD